MSVEQFIVLANAPHGFRYPAGFCRARLVVVRTVGAGRGIRTL